MPVEVRLSEGARPGKGQPAGEMSIHLSAGLSEQHIGDALTLGAWEPGDDEGIGRVQRGSDEQRTTGEEDSHDGDAIPLQALQQGEIGTRRVVLRRVRLIAGALARLPAALEPDRQSALGCRPRQIDLGVQQLAVLEVDGAPSHLDLEASLARRAVQAGVTLSIDSDAHRTEMLERHMSLGVLTARRGWVEPRNVLNVRSRADMTDFLARKRRR